MSRLQQVTLKRNLRKKRSRATINGTTERPRLSVFISNINISAQLIDDTKQKTVAQVTTANNKALKGGMSEKASWVGEEIAKAAKAAKIKKVVLDRSGHIYHGRIKVLAEAARKQGLEF